MLPAVVWTPRASLVDLWPVVNDLNLETFSSSSLCWWRSSLFLGTRTLLLWLMCWMMRLLAASKCFWTNSLVQNTKKYNCDLSLIKKNKCYSNYESWICFAHGNFRVITSHLKWKIMLIIWKQRLSWRQHKARVFQRHFKSPNWTVWTEPSVLLTVTDKTADKRVFLLRCHSPAHHLPSHYTDDFSQSRQ